jgi:hypothetical protein
MAEGGRKFIAAYVAGLLTVPAYGMFIGSEGPRPPAQVRKDESGVIIGYGQPDRDGRPDGFQIDIRGSRVTIFPSAEARTDSQQTDAINGGAEELFVAGCEVESANPKIVRSTTVGDKQLNELILETNVPNIEVCAQRLPPNLEE